MRSASYTGQFKRDVKLAEKRGKDVGLRYGRIGLQQLRDRAFVFGQREGAEDQRPTGIGHQQFLRRTADQDLCLSANLCRWFKSVTAAI